MQTAQNYKGKNFSMPLGFSDLKNREENFLLGVDHQVMGLYSP